MSDYFDAQSNRVSPGSTARSSDVNTLRDDTGEAFDKLPPLDDVYDGTANYGVAGGTANAVTVAMPTTVSSYNDGMTVSWKVTAANTGAVTINVDSVGVKDLKAKGGEALIANDLEADFIVTARYNSTADNFQLVAIVEATLDAKVTAAEAAQTAAEAAQSGAETAETGAQTAQSAAEAAQAAAETAQTGAETAETGAELAETAAVAAQSAAEDAQGYAEEWANAPEDTPVSVDAGGDGATEFSALHWANKASDIAAGAIFTMQTTAVDVTAQASRHITVTASGKTVTLPATPSAGDRVRITSGNFEDTTIGRNSENIMGVADDRIINKAYATIELVYNNSNWEVIK